PSSCLFASLFVACITSLPSAAQTKAHAPVERIEVPNGTRKCIKPAARQADTANKLLAPAACTAPVVNVSARTSNESESYVIVNPTNPNNLVTLSNLTTENSIFRGYSTNGGAT